MADEIRSIRIESNNICYGPEPGYLEQEEMVNTNPSFLRIRGFI